MDGLAVRVTASPLHPITLPSVASPLTGSAPLPPVPVRKALNWVSQFSMNPGAWSQALGPSCALARRQAWACFLEHSLGFAWALAPV